MADTVWVLTAARSGNLLAYLFLQPCAQDLCLPARNKGHVEVWLSHSLGVHNQTAISRHILGLTAPHRSGQGARETIKRANPSLDE